MILLGVLILRDRERTLAEGVPHRCPACGSDQPHGLYKTWRELSFLLLPLWRWRKEFVLACEVCGNVEFTSAAEAAALRRCGVQTEPRP